MVSTARDSDRPTICVAFGAFRMNLDSLELAEADGRAVPLPPKPSLALALLVGKAGSLVTREELREHVWPNTVIEFDQGINTCIAHLRSVLGDDAETPRFIETVPRRGYRFVAPVTRLDDDTAGPRTGQTRMAGFILATVAVFIAALMVRSATAEHSVRLVVLETEVTSAEADDSLIAAGLADEIRLAMAGVDPLRIQVLGRVTSSRASRTYSVPRMRSELDVDLAVETSLRREQGLLRLHVGLVDTESESIVWTSDLSVPVAGSFEVQEWIGRTIVSSIAAHAGVAPGQSYRALPGAVQAQWLVAQALARSEHTEDGEKALELVTHVLSEGMGSPEVSALRARLLIDLERYAEADSVLRGAESAQELVERGRLHLRRWNVERALDDLREAAAVSPGTARPHHYLAYALAVSGRLEEAAERIALARALDPVSAAVVGDAGLFELWAGRPDAAVEQCRAVERFARVGSEPAVSRCFVRGFSALNMPDSAVAYASAYLETNPPPLTAASPRPGGADDELLEVFWLWVTSPDNPQVGESTTPYLRAIALATFGRTEEAMAQLLEAERAREPRLLELEVERRFDEMRAEGDFAALSRRVRPGQ